MVALLADPSRSIDRVVSILRRLARSENTRYIAARYLGALLQAFEVLIISRLLGPASYGEYAMWVQIAALMTIAGIGGSWGFLLRYYREPEMGLAEIYCVGSVAQFAVGGVLGASLIALYDVSWTWALLYFAAQIVPSVIEPVMRVSGQALKYALIRAAAPVFTISLILSGGVAWLSRVCCTSPALSALILVAVTNGCSGLMFIGAYRRAMGTENRRPNSLAFGSRMRSIIGSYVRGILPRGIGAGITTIPYLINSNVDRVFLERNHSAEILGAYSLAWFLVQGGAISLHSINLLATARIGDSVSRSSAIEGVVRRQSALVALICFAVLGMLIVTALIIQNSTHRNFTDLALLTAIVGAGHLTFGIASVYVSAAFFEGKTKPTMLVLSAAGCFLVMNNLAAISYGWNHIQALLFSSAILLASNVILIWNGNRGRRPNKKREFV